MYRNDSLDMEKGVFDGCTEKEIKELKKRKAHEKWGADALAGQTPVTNQ